MKIEIYPQSMQDASIIEGLTKMFVDCISAINLPLDILEKIIITDETNWKSIVENLQREYYGEEIGYTKNSLYVAAAKTLSRKKGDGILTTIIFNDYVIFRPNNIAQLEEEGKAFFELCDYTVFHELGHCLDNFLRKQYEVKSFSFEDGKIIEPAFLYNSDILFSELAACVHSAKWMSEKALEFEMKSTKENLMQMYSYVEAVKQEFSDGRKTLYDLAFNAANLFWTTLIQHAKVIGIAIGLELDEFYINSLCPDNKGQEIITDLKNMLTTQWNNYPNFSGENKKELLDIWSKLAEENGYCFAHAQGGDCLYI